jgi:hypothetical protein
MIHDACLSSAPWGCKYDMLPAKYLPEPVDKLITEPQLVRINWRTHVKISHSEIPNRIVAQQNRYSIVSPTPLLHNTNVLLSCATARNDSVEKSFVVGIHTEGFAKQRQPPSWARPTLYCPGLRKHSSHRNQLPCLIHRNRIEHSETGRIRT